MYAVTSLITLPGYGSVSWNLWAQWALSSLVAQMVKNLPAMLETQVWSPGEEDTLEKGMATHCNILVWRISWTEEPGGLQSMRLQRVRHDRETFTASLMSHVFPKVHENCLHGWTSSSAHSLSIYLLRTVSVLGAADRRWVNKTQNRSQHQTASVLEERHSRFWLTWDLSSTVHGCRRRAS